MTDLHLPCAWKNDTDDPVIRSYILQPDFQPSVGQEFVWQIFANSHAKTVRSFHWSRRHVRVIGNRRTLCYQACGEQPSGHVWALQPNIKGVVDECPECRGMSIWYLTHPKMEHPMG